jgi:hypothetical protein
MHQGDALAESRIENGFALVYVHLDTNWLETNPVNLTRHKVSNPNTDFQSRSRLTAGPVWSVL